MNPNRPSGRGATRMRCLACVLGCLPVLALAAGERETRKLESVRERRASLERQLEQTEATRSAAAVRLREIEQAIEASTRKLRDLERDQAMARAERDARMKELRHLEAQTTERQAQLGQLLRYQARHEGAADALGELLAGGDPNETARDRHYLAVLSRAKAGLIADLKEDAQKTQRIAEIVRQREAQLQGLARGEEAERAHLQQRQQERQTVLAKLAEQIKSQRNAIETLKQDERRLGSLIDRLTRLAARATGPGSKSGRRAESHQSRSAAEPPARPGRLDAPAVAGNAAALRGKLLMPVQGTLAGRFGARREDGQSLWKGLFIRATEGVQVKAVADGAVVYAEWLRGYGNLVIVDHGDGLLSVYGNNQTLLAAVGQTVSAGMPVATVGTGGGLPDSGLYFELRYRGQAIDPSRWLGPR